MVGALSFTLSQAIEHAMPDEPSDAFYGVRALVALVALVSMTTTGLFGIGWMLSPRPAR